MSWGRGKVWALGDLVDLWQEDPERFTAAVSKLSKRQRGQLLRRFVDQRSMDRDRLRLLALLVTPAGEDGP